MSPPPSPREPRGFAIDSRTTDGGASSPGMPGVRPAPIPTMNDTDYMLNWAVQIRRGWIELCVLKALERGERYGYDLVRTLASLPGLGVTEGTLYPLLSRLRLQGLVSTRLVESPEGPARKYYTLTPHGRRTLSQMNGHVDTLVRQVRRLGDKEDAR